MGARRREKKTVKCKKRAWVSERSTLWIQAVMTYAKQNRWKEDREKMEVYTVSCHGGQLKAHRRFRAHTHPLLIPQFLSSRLQPSIPLLVFISASVMRTKESTHSFAPTLPSSLSPLLSPSLGLFRQGSQAWLAIVTWPHAGKIGTHAQTHTKEWPRVYMLTHQRGEKGGQGQFC